MSKKSLSFRELIELINASVKSGKIKKDYPDFLKSCRDLGISSYILNTIIIKAKESCDTNDNSEITDHSFWVPVKVQQSEKATEEKQEKEIIIKTIEKTSKTAWILLFILIVICIVETISLFNLNDKNEWYRRSLNELHIRDNKLEKTLTSIYVMTSNLSDDSSFSNWHSSNHEKSSESQNNYSFTASKGDKLSFNYYVSSEANYDFLTITIRGDSISSKDLVNVSGEYHNSRVYLFERGGAYKLQVKYSKDGTVDKFNDNAGVTDITLHRNFKNLLDSIHSISDIHY